MELTVNELDCIMKELDAIKSREKDPASRICLILAKAIVQEKQVKTITSEALKELEKYGK